MSGGDGPRAFGDGAGGHGAAVQSLIRAAIARRIRRGRAYLVWKTAKTASGSSMGASCPMNA